MATDEFLVAFLGFWPPTGADGLSGAAMVTNERGYPLEFRVTTPVRPSAMQKALYGTSLDSYLIVELVGRRLVSEIQRRAILCFTNSREAVAVESPFPMFFVAPTDSIVLTGDDAAVSYQRVEPTDGVSQALGLLSHDAAALAESLPQIKSIVRRFDPLGAFERMKTALAVLAESDARYR